MAFWGWMFAGCMTFSACRQGKVRGLAERWALTLCTFHQLCNFTFVGRLMWYRSKQTLPFPNLP